jgi:hypothetical protein
LEVKYHPLESDQQKLKRVAEKQGLSASWIIGRFPTPAFKDFLWGGLIF